MITYKWGATEYAADGLETAIRSGLAKQTMYYDNGGALEDLQRQVNALEEIVVGLAA